jgi:transposase
MSETIRKTYSPGEKAQIALEALKGNLTFNDLTKKYGVHATQINRWKTQLKNSIVEIFSGVQQKHDDDAQKLIDELYKKIGQLEVERDWLKKKCDLFNK